MMYTSVLLVLFAFATVFAAPALYNDYERLPQKRAALVLDRLLVALQKALHEENVAPRYDRTEYEGPRTAPLRIPMDDSDMSALERRGQSNNNRGRVLRCFFNAVTCF
ncbi:uncharacterized protein LOC114252699 [Bombyx mandarina]|uniref:Allatostatin CC n=2 Tax=Bombyx TaxID=7090 RepID=A0A8R2AKX0_BOMMO|nr:uncharacterized protein LOC101746311 [Bombyx mori]XP_012550909.1 uncharacterized protein LOC101746311 [Bombyx mori]XP_028043093.1 uncharacterized protein LOC114252699 [Bombyx mandarina]